MLHMLSADKQLKVRFNNYTNNNNSKLPRYSNVFCCDVAV